MELTDWEQLSYHVKKAEGYMLVTRMTWERQDNSFDKVTIVFIFTNIYQTSSYKLNVTSKIFKTFVKVY